MCALPTYSRYAAYKRLLIQTVIAPHTRQYATPAPSSIRHTHVSEAVAKWVRDKQQNKDGILVINNPGCGKIVKTFQDVGFKNIACTAVEKDTVESLQRAVGENVFCTELDVMTAKCEQLEEKILGQLPGSIHERGITILSTLNQKRNPQIPDSVFSVMAGKCLHYPGLLDTPQTEFFIFLTHRRYKGIESDLWMFSHKIYHSFFNIRHVMELDSTDFDPELVEDMGPKPPPGSKPKPPPSSKVHLVHFTPNQDVLTDMSIKDRMNFKKFVKLCLHKSTIITFLERYVPGSGLHLIRMGFTMSDENMRMTSQQYVAIYKALHSWPEFEGSPLQAIFQDKSFPDIPG